MRLTCCLCGRDMEQAAVMIGQMPVGPKCAKRAGLFKLSQRRAGFVLPAIKRQRNPAEDQKTLELFPDD